MINDADFQKAVELIGKSNKVLITTHTRPDGDGCGCIAAISETLTTLGKNPKILLLSEAPPQYKFLFKQPVGEDVATDSRTRDETRDTSDELNKSVKSVKSVAKCYKSVKSVAKFAPDLIVIVDTDTYNQLPQLVPLLSSLVPPPSSLVIDHHVTSDNLGDVRLIDNSAAATALIVFDLLKYAGWPITKKIAEALFVAVSTDTGWFQFDNTDSRTLKVCAELIDAASSLVPRPSSLVPRPSSPVPRPSSPVPRPTSLVSRMYRQLYQNTSPQQFSLMVAMLNTLELHLEGRFAMQHLSQEDFKKTGAKYSDTENLIDSCRKIKGVEAAALFVEQPNGQIKASLRSWPRFAGETGRDAIDVSKIANKFEGGGHKMAAGAVLPGPIENAKKRVLNVMAKQFKQST